VYVLPVAGASVCAALEGVDLPGEAGDEGGVERGGRAEGEDRRAHDVERRRGDLRVRRLGSGARGGPVRVTRVACGPLVKSAVGIHVWVVYDPAAQKLKTAFAASKQAIASKLAKWKPRVTLR